MNNLVEHILAENYVEASNIFEDRLNTILEKKLIEKKKMMQAEAVGGLTAAQVQARKELGWKKASDVLPDPRDYSLSSVGSKQKLQKAPVKKRKKLKEEISRSDVEAEKEKLRKTHPGFKSVQVRKKINWFSKHPEKKPKDGDADLRKTFGAERPEDKKRPGIIARNLNTLVGREPGYKAEPKSPEEKGGKVGKALNLAYRGISRFGSEVGW